jgi:hypothetical protein
MYIPMERSQATVTLEENPQLREMSDEAVLNELKSRLKTVNVDGETYYVAEGDLLLDEDQLFLYSLERKAKEMQRLIGTLEPIGREGELLGITVGGKLVRWKPGLNLSYCVLKNTFTSEAEYQLMRDNMLKATQDWEKTCGVKFEYKADLDNNTTTQPADVLFTVRQIDAGGQFIAAAFFPNDPPARRRVLIDPSYFTTGFDKVGVLRHELGHVLGFRHEHIRSGAPADCPDESTTNTFPFSAYDPKSVMHYFCGGVGSTQLAISDVDKTGSQMLYGLPLDSFRYVG